MWYVEALVEKYDELSIRKILVLGHSCSVIITPHLVQVKIKAAFINFCGVRLIYEVLAL